MAVSLFCFAVIFCRPMPCTIFSNVWGSHESWLTAMVNAVFLNGSILRESWGVFWLKRGVSDRIWCIQYTSSPPPKCTCDHQDDFFLGPRRTHVDHADPEINDFKRFRNAWVEPTYRFHDCISANLFQGLNQDGICSSSRGSLMWGHVGICWEMADLVL